MIRTDRDGAVRFRTIAQLIAEREAESPAGGRARGQGRKALAAERRILEKLRRCYPAKMTATKLAGNGALSVLLALVIAGRVECHDGGLFRLAPPAPARKGGRP